MFGLADSRTLARSRRCTGRLIIVVLLIATVATTGALGAPVAGAAAAHSAQPPTSHALCVSLASTTSTSSAASCTCYDVYCSRVVTTTLGYDACQEPDTPGMQDWWDGSPYYWANLYIGGLNWGCRPLPSYLNSSWTQTIKSQGWQLVPTWVSYQAPCAWSGYGAQMSWDTGTAYNQGYNEAASAVQVAEGLSIGGSSIIYDDMENFSGSSSCYAAVAAFVNGWSTGLHTFGFGAGMYEAPADLVDLCGRAGSLTEPDDIWIADWNGNTDTNNTSPLSNGCWQYSQRLHQYNGNVNNVTYCNYGQTHCTTLSIDEDSANGDVSQ